MTPAVYNERLKLTAAALNTAATSSFTVGVLAPLAASFYAIGPVPVSRFALAIGTLLWLSLAVVLHMLALRLLTRLRV